MVIALEVTEVGPLVHGKGSLDRKRIYNTYDQATIVLYSRSSSKAPEGRQLVICISIGGASGWDADLQ